MISKLEKAMEASICYVESKLCQDGGYSFYKDPHLEESSIYDTYYAIKSLLMFNKPISEKTKTYIIDSFMNADTLEKYYFSVRAMELIKENPQKYKKQIDLPINLSMHIQKLEDINLELLRLLRYKRLSDYYKYIDVKNFEKELLDIIKQHFNMLDIKTLSLMYAISQELFLDDITNYLSQSYAIVPLPNTSYTNITTLYAGYFLLKAINRELYNLEKAKEIVLKSQDKYGAFPEIEESLPDLRTNFCGLYILSL